MAVVIKRREVAPPPPPPVIDQEQEDILAQVGLIDAKPGGVVIKRRPSSFSEGQRVRVASSLFHWVALYKQGDLGTVLMMQRAPNGPYSQTPRDDLYVVKLDHPRVEGRDIVHLAHWQIEKE